MANLFSARVQCFIVYALWLLEARLHYNLLWLSISVISFVKKVMGKMAFS